MVGDNPGSKAEKAEKLGVEIIDEEQLQQILANTDFNADDV